MNYSKSATSSSITVAGSDVFYIEQGTGPVLLLIHGLGADSSRWQYNVQKLAEHYRVIAIDLPGFGRSGKPNIPCRGQYFVDVLHEFLNAKGVQSVSLIGNSMGGWLSMLFARRFPNRVSHLILVAPAFYLGLPPGVSAKNIIAGAKPQSHQAMQGYLERVLHAPPKEPATISDMLIAHQKNNTGTAIEQVVYSLSENMDTFSLEELGTLNKKTLLIHGTSDGIVPVAATRQLGKVLPNATIKLVEKAGHWPQFEQPENFNQQVLEFLEVA